MNPMPDTEPTLRQRSIPDRLDYLAEKLGSQLDFAKVPSDTIAVVGAAIMNLRAIATEVRALLNEREQQNQLLARFVGHEDGFCVLDHELDHDGECSDNPCPVATARKLLAAGGAE